MPPTLPPGSLRASNTESASALLPTGRGGCTLSLNPEHRQRRPQAPLRKHRRLQGRRPHRRVPAWSSGHLLPRLHLHPTPAQELKGFQYQPGRRHLNPSSGKALRWEPLPVASSDRKAVYRGSGAPGTSTPADTAQPQTCIQSAVTQTLQKRIPSVYKDLLMGYLTQ